MIKFFIEPGYFVKHPERDSGNSGIDFFIPEYSETFAKAFKDKNTEDNAILCSNADDKMTICIMPHGRVNIPSGVRSHIPANVALEAQNKSGIATKFGLVYGASTCDPNYQGIIHISLINTTSKAIELPLGMKAVQFLAPLAPWYVNVAAGAVSGGVLGSGVTSMYKSAAS